MFRPPSLRREVEPGCPGASRKPPRRGPPGGAYPGLTGPFGTLVGSGEGGDGPGGTVAAGGGQGGQTGRRVPRRDGAAGRRDGPAVPPRPRDRRYLPRPGRAVGRVPVGPAHPRLVP